MKKYLLFFFCSCVALLMMADDGASSVVFSPNLQGNFVSPGIVKVKGVELLPNGGGLIVGPIRPCGNPIDGLVVTSREGGGVSPFSSGSGPLFAAGTSTRVMKSLMLAGIYVYGIEPIIGPMGGGLVGKPIIIRPGNAGGDGKRLPGVKVVSRDGHNVVVEPPVITPTPNPGDSREVMGVDENDAPHLPGDVNADGIVDILDVTDMISHVMGQTPEGFNVKNAHVNGSSLDSSVDISDVTALIQLELDGNSATAH